MVIELVAGRMIAGNLGASLYTWTSVIGVVLGGLSIGNYVGGRLADRFEINRTLSALFMAASAASVFIAISDNLVGDLRTLWMFSWPARVLSHVMLVFFLPSCILGMIGPVAAKRALEVGQEVGRHSRKRLCVGCAGEHRRYFRDRIFVDRLAWNHRSHHDCGIRVGGGGGSLSASIPRNLGVAGAGIRDRHASDRRRANGSRLG
jgi:hypothetical protein